MAIKIWKGNAKPVVQIDTLTPANVEIGDIFTVTINGKSISVTATAATVANVTALLAAALTAAGQTIAEFGEITWTDSTTLVTCTGRTPGKPFTVTSAATNGGAADTQTLTQATTTACSGSNFFNVAANWSGGTLPADDDVIVFENSDVDCLYGLSNATTTPQRIIIKASYTGKIGLPRHTGTYYEYRDTSLRIGQAADASPTLIAIEIGQGDGSGSSRIRIDTGDKQATVKVWHTAFSTETGAPAFNWIGTHASNTVDVYSGSVGIAAFEDQAATVATCKIGYQDSINNDSNVVIGSGVTLTTLTKTGGQCELNCAATTVTNEAGELTINGSGAIDTLNITGGTVYSNTSGVVGGTAINLAGKGQLDFSRSMVARTLGSTPNVYGDDADILDPHRVVTTDTSELSIDYKYTSRFVNQNILNGTVVWPR